MSEIAEVTRWRRLIVALHAVSTSRAMPNWPKYIEAVQSMDHLRTNPPEPQLGSALREAVRVVAIAERPPTLHGVELLTALVSFVDDHAEPPAVEAFPLALSRRILRRFSSHRDLTIDEQLKLALDEGAPDLLTAVLALHLSIRVLARGRDARLHSDFDLGLERRLEIGRAIAPFHPLDAQGGDPLGDTYHFWANVAAGIYASADNRDLTHLVVFGMMLSGPRLMSMVRQGLFGNYLFFGNHARIDHLGLKHGIRIGRQTQMTRSKDVSRHSKPDPFAKVRVPAGARVEVTQERCGPPPRTRIRKPTHESVA